MPDIRKQNNTGHTLAEVLVSLACFMILSAIVAGALLIGTKYFKIVDESIQAKRLVRDCMDIMTTDMNEAIPNPDPGSKNPPTGYLGVKPPPPKKGTVEWKVLTDLKKPKLQPPTAFLMPNINKKTSDHVIFNKPDFENFNPTRPGFYLDGAENYKVIKYYVQDNTLFREEKTINPDSSYNSPVVMPIAGVTSGTMSISARHINLRTIDLTITITSGGATGKKYTDTATVTVMAFDKF
jgi:type II secretory pathway pseudopilin PulG